MALNITNVAQAQTKSLDDLFVTAKSNSTSKEMAASTTVITAEEIAQTGATNLQDVLKNVPGFSYTINSASTYGRENIGLRGMDSEHVLILIDGERINSSDGFIGHSNYQSSWVDVGSIERVEVIKGAGSVLYGSEAMGGVINIITKSANKKSFVRYSASTSTLPNRDGGEKNRISLNSGLQVNDKLYIGGNVAASETAESFENSITKFEGDKNKTAQFNLAYKFTPSTEILLGISGGHEERIVGNDLYYDIERLQKSVELKTKLGSWDSSFKAYQVESDAGYSGFGYSPYYTHHIDDTILRAEFMGSPIENHFVTWGIERHTVDYTKDYTNPASTDYKATGTAQNSAFVQDKFKLGSGTITAGVRLDDNDQFGSETSPELGYVMPITENMDLKFQYSQAYNAPNIKEADDNYVYTHGYPGATAMQGNSDLKPETSQSFEVGLSGLLGTTSWSASVYRTQANDLIEMQDTGTTYAPTGGTLYKYANVDEATITGAELIVSADLTSNLYLDASYNRMETDNGNGGQLSFRPDQTIKAKLTYDMPWDISTNWSVNYTGESKDGLNDVSGYTINDFAINKRFTKAINVQFAINNVFDVLNDDVNDNYITELPGREYKLTLSGSF
ncbi:catecholate siderophore receptor CirA [Thiomicrorhabdus hydrogeniphila]